MAEITVTSTADSGAGSLRQAIVDANDGDVILFDDEIFPPNQTTSILLSSNINVNKQLTIDAASTATMPGATTTPRVAIDAQNNSRCLYLQPGAGGTLRGFLFCNASNSTNGGAVYCSATNPITFTQCRFSNNQGNTGGGVSTTVAAAITFDACEFSGNTASSHGGAVYCSSGATLTFDDCTFSGNTTSASGGAFFSTGTCQSTFNSCVFSGNSAATNGGGVSLTSTSQSTLNGCAITNCNASDGGGVFSANSSQSTLNDCIISGCNSSTYGGGFSGGSASQNILNDCTISGCRAASNAGGLYVRGTSQNTLNNCTIAANTSEQDVTKRDAIIGETSVAIIHDSKIGALRINQTAQVTVQSGITTVDTLTLLDSGGVYVTITIADGAALTITTSATIGAATFTSSGRAYLATATGLDFSAATLNNVVLCSYGAGLESFSARETTRTEIKLDWTQTDATIPVLVEQKVGNAWETVVESTAGTYNVTVEPATRHLFRAFDGVSFHVDAAWHGIEALQFKVIGIIVEADAQDVNWQAITEVVNVDGAVRSGQSITILARVYDAYENETVLLNETGNIVSVVYTLEKRSKSLFDYTWTPVEGHNEVEVSSECVLEDLQTSDAWTVDEVGYSFVLTPDTTEHTLFATPGVYRFRVKITLAEGNPVVFYEEINVVDE